jgi:hypothetical protein
MGACLENIEEGQVVPLCHSKVAARLVHLSLTAAGRHPHKLHENQASDRLS